MSRYTELGPVEIARRIRQKLGLIATAREEISLLESDIVELRSAAPNGFPHQGVMTGQCPLCGHYGDDCKGSK